MTKRLSTPNTVTVFVGTRRQSTLTKQLHIDWSKHLIAWYQFLGQIISSRNKVLNHKLGLWGSVFLQSRRDRPSIRDTRIPDLLLWWLLPKWKLRSHLFFAGRWSLPKYTPIWEVRKSVFLIQTGKMRNHRRGLNFHLFKCAAILWTTELQWVPLLFQPTLPCVRKFKCLNSGQRLMQAYTLQFQTVHNYDQTVKEFFWHQFCLKHFQIKKEKTLSSLSSVQMKLWKQ